MITLHRWGRLSPLFVRCSVRRGKNAYSSSATLWAAAGAPPGAAGPNGRDHLPRAGAVSAVEGGSTAASCAPGKSEDRQGEQGEGDGSNDDTSEADATTPVWGRPTRKQRVEVEHGHFHEFTAVNKTAGKLFYSEKAICTPEEAAPFPEMEASSLAGQVTTLFPEKFLGEVTLVGLYHRQFGYEMLPTWLGPFDEHFISQSGGGHNAETSRGGQGKRRGGGMGGGRRRGSMPPSAVPRALHVSLIESTALRLIQPFVVRSMEGKVAKEEKGRFYYRFGGSEKIREELDVVNRLTLYVLLVDQEGLVRWRACGKATRDEVDTLIECTHQLLEEGQGRVRGTPRGRI